MYGDDPEAIRQHLVELRLRHRALDEAIAALAANPDFDQLQLRRLKKQKLELKDAIARHASKLIPDLDA